MHLLCVYTYSHTFMYAHSYTDMYTLHIYLCQYSFTCINVPSNTTDPPRFLLFTFIMRTAVFVKHIERTSFLTSAQFLLSGPSLPTCDGFLSCQGLLRGPLLIPSQCGGVVFSLFQLNIRCQVTPLKAGLPHIPHSLFRSPEH